ncbi:hypothetical protein DSO57_1036190 [Entomophthora muscae]|uniref:Uncharacterized protein n=1 Tax=Entomophthora muscae TaxID=34485 RepID=A0ACC2SNR5_9FUNG|nr:hypothetical protein DSO57_1036190 [Entomophthora muscae]
MTQSDCFDELLFLEERFYEEGLDSGKAKSEEIGFSQGKEEGAHYGFEFGQKIGFLEGFAKTIIELDSEDDRIPKRAIANLKSILSTIESIPAYNDHSLDYNKLMSQLQAKAKMVCVMLNLPYSETPLHAPSEVDLTY